MEEFINKELLKISSLFSEKNSYFNKEDVEIKIGISPFKLRKIEEFLFKKENPNSQLSELKHQGIIKIKYNDISFILYRTNDVEKLKLSLDENGNEIMEII